MKLNIKEDNIAKFSFKDLEYGLQLIKAKKISIMKELCDKVLDHENGQSVFRLRMDYTAKFKRIDDQISLIENELGERMLTGNDDGMLERELLGG